ncbi:MAG: sensor domain-containing diguanylate cyclase [Acholeplasmatales bacterium]|nr:MAG: sensor domain-containing diguanylate cyclase [Acholeplasmatales bacterium]
MDDKLKAELYDFLKTDEQVLEYLLDDMFDGAFFMDLKRERHEWLNKTFFARLGIEVTKRQDVDDFDWRTQVVAGDLKMAEHNLLEHLSHPDIPLEGVVRYRHLDGSIIWMRYRGIVIRDESGAPSRLFGTHTDITAYKQAELEIKRLNEEYQRIFNGTQDTMFLVEILGYRRFRFIRNNTMHEKLTGISYEQLKGKTPEDLMGEEVGAQITSHYQRCVDLQEAITYEERLPFKTGYTTWLTTLTPHINPVGFSYIVGSSKEISHLKELEIKLHRSAYHDYLTQLPNRRNFFEHIEARFAKTEETPCALLFIDLNDFKAINDRFGHQMGDQVLIDFARFLKKHIVEDAFIARVGGDEFMVLLEGHYEESKLKCLIEHLQNGIRVLKIFDRINAVVTPAIGYARFPEDGHTIEKLVKEADRYMYQNKTKHKT